MAKKQAIESNGGDETPVVCGLVMPISEIDGCGEHHWAQVREILSDAVTEAGFKPNLVSDADDVGVIQKRIVQNLYDNPIAVCDVSAKNPNVMFELGMRLAFDKPTVIVKDDVTTYSFDTSVIEHLPYPRDLRFPMIVNFKKKLVAKIQATHKKSDDPDFSPFLGHFGKFKVAKIETEEVPAAEVAFDEIQADLREVKRLLLSGKSSSSDESDMRIGRERADKLLDTVVRTWFQDHDTFEPEDFGEITRIALELAEGSSPPLHVKFLLPALRDRIREITVDQFEHIQKNRRDK